MNRTDSQQVPRLLVAPHTGLPVLAAPRRRLRPHFFGPEGASRPCPFCQGNEQQTPPEIHADRDPGSNADGPGWRVRAFPNLFPAADQHLVIAEGRDHFLQPGQLDARTWQGALAVAVRCLHDIESQGQHGFWFKNVGPRAGASVAHNHSQVIGLPDCPPRLQLELEQARSLGRCPLCEDMASAEREGRLVLETSAHMVFCPRTPRLPYETMLARRRHHGDLCQAGDTELADLAAALHSLFVAVDRAFENPPFNTWLHRIRDTDFHPHFELQLRTGNLAGLELGADVSINSVAADEAAARLRGAL